MEDKKNILITGGAGFIGTNLTKTLLEKNNLSTTLGTSKVFCIDNLNDYYSPEIKKNNIKQFKNNPNYKFQKMDIENLNDLKKLFSKEKLAFHSTGFFYVTIPLCLIVKFAVFVLRTFLAPGFSFLDAYKKSSRKAKRSGFFP